MKIKIGEHIKIKDHTMPFLYAKLEEMGLPCTRRTVLNWIRDGKLKLRRRPSGWKVVNEKEVNEIIRAFSPGGRGKWGCK